MAAVPHIHDFYTLAAYGGYISIHILDKICTESCWKSGRPICICADCREMHADARAEWQRANTIPME